jgi:hypothetical protein
MPISDLNFEIEKQKIEKFNTVIFFDSEPAR